MSNDVYGNSIHDNRGGGIRVLRSPQGRVCGNPMRGNLGGDVVGTYGSTIRPTAPCDDGSPGPASEVDASG